MGMRILPSKKSTPDESSTFPEPPVIEARRVEKVYFTDGRSIILAGPRISHFVDGRCIGGHIVENETITDKFQLVNFDVITHRVAMGWNYRDGCYSEMPDAPLPSIF